MYQSWKYVQCALFWKNQHNVKTVDVLTQKTTFKAIETNIGMTSEKLYRNTIKCTAKEKKREKRILVHHGRLILLCVCSSVKRKSCVRNPFKITLYFQSFSRKKVKFQFKKIFVRCQADSVNQYTAIWRKVVGKSARDNPERYCGSL